MKRGKKKEPLSMQRKKHIKEQKSQKKKKAYDGNTETMISTGSTLLDLAISGGRKRGGGLPGGIMLEIFGPEGSGKTVLLCEIGGAIQRAGGSIKFNDPEARLNRQFASMFDLDFENLTVEEPNTVTEVIKGVKDWEPEEDGNIHGIMTDSLAALSTNMEMDNEEGDKMGMRRAKEFSEGLRKICRILKKKNYILACSNQIRVKANAQSFGEQFDVPGGKAIAFYSSVRLRVLKPEKIQKEVSVGGKKRKKPIGVKSTIEVYKNSVDAPYRKADVIIQFDYGIDDIKANLMYLKDYTKASSYFVRDESLGTSLEKAVQKVEKLGLEKQLREEVIDLWETVEEKFKVERKKKVR